MKKIPLFKAQNIQHTHPGKFVNKFAAGMKQEEKKEENVDFFDNLKDFVDGIELGIGENKPNTQDVFLTNNPQQNNPSDKVEKAEKSVDTQPLVHTNYLRGSGDFKYQNHMNSFVQNLYSKYIKKKQK